MPHRIKNVTSEVQAFSRLHLLIWLITIPFLSACGGSSESDSSSEGAFSISGKINLQRDSDVDLDLNSDIAVNNTLNDPQIIANPTTIGGYLSAEPGNYANGQVFNSDAVDAFSVSLVEGQEIYLSVFPADDTFDDVDILFKLIDDNNQEVLSKQVSEFSASTLIVPNNGSFTLSLEALNSSSPLLYTLSLSSSLAQQSLLVSSSEDLKQGFVSGEVLIRFKGDSASKVMTNQSGISKSRLDTVVNIEERYQLTLKKSIASISNVYQFNSDKMKQAFNLSHSDPQNSVNMLEQKIQTLKLINDLQQHEDIEFAEPNFIYTTTGLPNDPLLESQWNLSMLGSEAAWKASTGQDIVIAVLDTGIDVSHEEWGGKPFSDSYDFVSNTSSSGDGNGFDANPNDEGSSFHGSHVAGIIAATADNSKGLAGVAYDSNIMALRVLGIQDTGSSSDIADAILYAAGLSNGSGLLPSKAADIINMSFGSESLSQTIKQAIDQAYSQGLILVAAAGNSGTDKSFYPAAFSNVIGVGSVTNAKERSSFSNFGENIDLMAPGGTGSGSADFDGFQDAILSTIDANNYSDYQGTSMAAPHVSAVAALMKELKPDLDGASFVQAIDSGDITDAPKSSLSNSSDFYGMGIINAAKAVKWAANSVDIIPATLSVYPSKFGFIGSNTSAQLDLTNQGDGSINIVSITEDEEWLIVSPANINSTTKLGSYLVETSPLLPLDQGEITINYQVNGGDIEQKNLNVFISSNNQTDSTVGSLSISIFKEDDVLNDNLTPFISVGGQLVNGAYHYCFNALPSGRYLLSASTDNDKDQLNFDKGEAVGSYPLLARPSFIEVTNQHQRDIDFDVKFPAFSSSNTSVENLSRDSVFTLYQPENISLNRSNFVSQNTCGN